MKLKIGNLVIDNVRLDDNPAEIAKAFGVSETEVNAALTTERERLEPKMKKVGIQKAIANDFDDGDLNAAALSLIGKTSNALSAALNIHMQVYQNLANVQSLEDVRAAVTPALPLMQKVSEKLENGELLSVQYVQNMSDEDAVIEGLEAMTRAARIIRAQSADTAG